LHRLFPAVQLNTANAITGMTPNTIMTRVTTMKIIINSNDYLRLIEVVTYRQKDDKQEIPALRGLSCLLSN
jgi:hypothetical protein